MKILINQFLGLGDIIFCMTIARRWMKEGHSITWPVLPQFVEGLQRAYPDITFCDWRTVKIDYERRDEHDSLGYRVVPLRWNVEIMGVPYERCMETKYTLFNYDYHDWKEGAGWNRDYVQEAKLFDKWQSSPYPYNLVNRRFQSDAKGYIPIQPNNDLPNIDMSYLLGFSIFDWASVLQHASEIHTVSTSLLYLLELLDIDCQIHLYPRPTDPKFNQVKYLFTKPYILH